MKIKKLNIHDAFEFIFPVNKDHRDYFLEHFVKKLSKSLRLIFRLYNKAYVIIIKGTVRVLANW